MNILLNFSVQKLKLLIFIDSVEKKEFAYFLRYFQKLINSWSEFNFIE